MYRYLPSGHTFFSYEVKEQIFFYKGGEKYLFSGYFTQYDYEIYENWGGGLADLNSPLNLC